MLKEYFAVRMIIADVPDHKDYSNHIVDLLVEEMYGLTKENLQSFIQNSFGIIEGELVEIEENENE